MRQALAKKLAEDNKDTKTKLAALEQDKVSLTAEAAIIKALVQKLSKEVESERQAATAAAEAAEKNKETATEWQRQLALSTAQVSQVSASSVCAWLSLTCACVSLSHTGACASRHAHM